MATMHSKRLESDECTILTESSESADTLESLIYISDGLGPLLRRFRKGGGLAVYINNTTATKGGDGMFNLGVKGLSEFSNSTRCPLVLPWEYESHSRSKAASHRMNKTARR